MNIVAYSKVSCAYFAEYYAKLTYRSFIKVNSVKELLEIDEVDVYVTDTFEQEYLEKLSDPTCIISRTTAVGIIYAPQYPTTKDLLRRIATQSLQVAHGIKNRVAIYPFKFINTIKQEQEDLILGIDAPNEAILNAIVQPRKGLMSIFTHGGGYDAYITPSLTLCAMTDTVGNISNSRLEGNGAPLCKSVNFCWRHNKQFNAKDLNRTLISAAQIPSDLLLLHTCFNVSPEGGKLSKEFSLVEQILIFGKAKTLITFYGLNISNELLCEILGDAIAQAKSIGKGLKDYLLMTQDIEKLERPLLFGDPKAQLTCRSYTLENGKVPLENFPTTKNQLSQRPDTEKDNISSMIDVSSQNEQTFKNLDKFDYKFFWSSYCEKQQATEDCISCDCRLSFFKSNSAFEYQPRVIAECCGCGIVTQDKPLNNLIRIERTSKSSLEIKPMLAEGEKWVIVDISIGERHFNYEQHFENGQSITNALCVTKKHLNSKFDMKVKVLHKYKSALEFVFLALKN